MGCNIMILMFSCLLGMRITSAQEDNVAATNHGARGVQEGTGDSSTKKQQVAGQLQQTGQTQTEHPPDQVERQAQTATENAEEEIAKQEQAARDLEKAVVGLEIAQGAIEITLGAIRIAAAATTGEALKRNEAIAASRASNAAANTAAGAGFEGPNNGPTSVEPIRRDSLIRKRAACTRLDPYSIWNDGYHQRIRRSSFFGPLLGKDMHSFSKSPTPAPNSNSYPVKLPTTDDADNLLNLLENLLDTNNQVLTLLGIDLPPLTNQATNPGTVLLREYRQRLDKRKQFQRQYGDTGYVSDGMVSDMLNEDRKWRSNTRHRPDVHTFTGELAQLNRLRRRLIM